MIYLIIVVWLVSILIYLRASALAIGKTRKKFALETFLLEQQIAALLSLLGLILSIIFRNNIAIIVNIVNLLYIFLFYLQPTPRVTRILLKLFIATNIILFVVAIVSLT